jgi:hypothetical protein
MLATLNSMREDVLKFTSGTQCALSLHPYHEQQPDNGHTPSKLPYLSDNRGMAGGKHIPAVLLEKMPAN